MKALTAFRNALKRRGTILSIKTHYLLCSDDIIEFRVKFHFRPRRKGKDYEAFVAAREKANAALKNSTRSQW